MKQTILLHALMLGMASATTGCSTADDREEQKVQASKLIFKVPRQEVVTKAGDGTEVEQTIFTGDDILWFNASTGEIRFNNNISQKKIIEGVLARTIRFYIDDEYLFSSLINVSDISSQIYDSPVFHYSIIENRFYIRDGYPDVSVLQNSEKHQKMRDENMSKIKPEWDRFINRLQVEGKLANNP